MPRSENQKLKLLYLTRILIERTDEEHSMTAQELINALAVYDIKVERKTIYADIELLRQFGLDIELRRGKTPGYYVASRDFELPELKLLVDAVQSSRLITSKKSEELIGKLSRLTSNPQAKQLQRQVYVTGRAKAFNENVYYSIDAIHAAISEGRKISFQYFDYDVSKRRIYRKNKEAYIRTPVALCWNDDKYYLITYSPKYEDGFTHFRVDRMNEVQMLDEPADIYKKFNMAEYTKRIFGMYNGETVKARLMFKNGIANTVLDHFGNKTRLTAAGCDGFTIEVDVSASPVFLAWMFQFGERAEILAPDSLREAMRELASASGKLYKK